jgi:hypothetical protein
MTSTGKLLLICASRSGTSVATMVYAGSLPYPAQRLENDSRTGRQRPVRRSALAAQ